MLSTFFEWNVAMDRRPDGWMSLEAVALEMTAVLVRMNSSTVQSSVASSTVACASCEPASNANRLPGGSGDLVGDLALVVNKAISPIAGPPIAGSWGLLLLTAPSNFNADHEKVLSASSNPPPHTSTFLGFHTNCNPHDTQSNCLQFVDWPASNRCNGNEQLVSVLCVAEEETQTLLMICYSQTSPELPIPDWALQCLKQEIAEIEPSIQFDLLESQQDGVAHFYLTNLDQEQPIIIGSNAKIAARGTRRPTNQLHVLFGQ